MMKRLFATMLAIAALLCASAVAEGLLSYDDADFDEYYGDFEHIDLADELYRDTWELADMLELALIDRSDYLTFDNGVICASGTEDGITTLTIKDASDYSLYGVYCGMRGDDARRAAADMGLTGQWDDQGDSSVYADADGNRLTIGWQSNGRVAWVTLDLIEGGSSGEILSYGGEPNEAPQRGGSAYSEHDDYMAVEYYIGEDYENAMYELGLSPYPQAANTLSDGSLFMHYSDGVIDSMRIVGPCAYSIEGLNTDMSWAQAETLLYNSGWHFGDFDPEDYLYTDDYDDWIRMHVDQDSGRITFIEYSSNP